jgi:hypothetical protein
MCGQQFHLQTALVRKYESIVSSKLVRKNKEFCCENGKITAFVVVRANIRCGICSANYEMPGKLILFC